MFNNCIILTMTLFHIMIQFLFLLKTYWVSERLLLNSNSAISLISRREQVDFQWEHDEVRFVIDQHAQLTEKTVGGYTYCPTWTHYPDS
jgi:hypothetical protein